MDDVATFAGIDPEQHGDFLEGGAALEASLALQNEEQRLNQTETGFESRAAGPVMYQVELLDFVVSETLGLFELPQLVAPAVVLRRNWISYTEAHGDAVISVTEHDRPRDSMAAPEFDELFFDMDPETVGTDGDGLRVVKMLLLERNESAARTQHADRFKVGGFGKTHGHGELLLFRLWREQRERDHTTKSFLGFKPSVRLGSTTNHDRMPLTRKKVKEGKQKIPRKGDYCFRFEKNLCRSFGKCPEGASRKAYFHPTNALGLEVDGKRATSVTLGMANFVTGLSTSTGELADAAHRDKIEYV